MKKIVLFCLILTAIPIIVISGSSKSENRYNYYPNLPKNDKWEYVKERIFDGETENIRKFSGPILIELESAHSIDSAAVDLVFEELRALIPHKKIDYFKNYTGTSLINPEIYGDKKIKGYKYSVLQNFAIKIRITEVESKDEAYTLDNKIFLDAVVPNGIFLESYRNVSGFNSTQFYFKFHKSQSVKERMEMIRFYLVRIISCANLFKERINGKFDIKGAMLNSNEATSWHLDFTDYDKFLLQKLYSPTLIEEYKDYMFKTYPWRFASNFINKERTEVIANWVRSIFGVLFFLLGFSIFYKRTFKFSYISYLLPVLLVLLCFFNIDLLYNYMITTGNHITFEEYLLVCFAHINIAFILALCLWVFDKYVVKNNMSFMLQLVLKIGFTFLVLMTPVIIGLITDKKVENWFVQSSPFLVLVFLFSLGRGLLIYLNHFSENLVKQKDVELSQLKELNAQAEVKLLQSQINPHFLYNSLNSIASLAHKDASKTEKMALALSDLFNYTINRKGKEQSTIGDEIEMVKNYLEVEQIRFGDRLDFSILVDEGLNDTEIPMFLIQPLVENAVKHGISKIEDAGVIHLKISKNENDVIISVKDNGPDFPDVFVSGHGLQSVYDLLKLSYGDNAIVNMQNTPEKEVSITIKHIV